MSLWKKKPFWILCCATTISSFGDSLYSLACTLTVYALSGSLSGVAGMWLIRALIRIPGQFFAGVMADCFDRKKISIGIYLISAVLVSLFLLTDKAGMLFAFVLIFLLQGTSDVDNIAQMAILPEIVEKEELQSANSAFQMAGTVVMLTGPAVGGILYKLYGSDVLFLIDAGTFVAAALVMTALPYRYVQGRVKKDAPRGRNLTAFPLFRLAKEGFAEIGKHPEIRAVIGSSVFLGIMGRFYEIDKVYMADRVFGIGAEGIVYFAYATSAGSLLAPVLLKILNKKDCSAIRSYQVFFVLTVISFVMWGCAGGLWLCLMANVLAGCFQTGLSVYSNLIFQKTVDNACLGRVTSFYKIMVVISAVIGILLAPVLVEALGVGGSMGIAGGAALVCLWIFFAIFGNV